MIAIDTSVLVRFLVGDDPEQSGAARAFMAGLAEDRPGFVCREVMLELAWVLERTYKIDRRSIADAFDDLIAAREIEIETADDVAACVAGWRAGGAGLGDRLIASAARRAGADAFVTFDRKAALLPGGTLLGERS